MVFPFTVLTPGGETAQDLSGKRHRHSAEKLGFAGFMILLGLCRLTQQAHHHFQADVSNVVIPIFLLFLN